ncbi:MAG TPA: alpha/beta fold hydrolase [Nocardioides sp.]|nr:alpha/beta fold hydrolase [Nocardioides sp.]
MSTPTLTLTQLAGQPGMPLLVVGPSLGTGVASLWNAAAVMLGDDFHVVGWDLPGHGSSTPATDSFALADLAAGVVAAVDAALGAVPFRYAGDSLGGAVGLHLALDHADRVSSVVPICTLAKLGTAEAWHERAAFVRASGTAAMVAGSSQRWFAPGFLDRSPEAGGALLRELVDVDDESYAKCCEALAAYDVTDRLGEISVPILGVAGGHDQVAAPEAFRAHLVRIPGARFVVLDTAGHLAPVEAPAAVASLLIDDVRGPAMAVRRAVLGDAHVDRASAGITDVTRDYQDLITRHAWHDIWTRPGLARRDRSIAVLTALIAGRHFEELEFHIPAALRNGLTKQEIVEVILQSAIYVGVPAANSAFVVAKQVLGDADLNAPGE